jgi:hypothetical protein
MSPSHRLHQRHHKRAERAGANQNFEHRTSVMFGILPCPSSSCSCYFITAIHDVHRLRRSCYCARQPDAARLSGLNQKRRRDPVYQQRLLASIADLMCWLQITRLPTAASRRRAGRHHAAFMAASRSWRRGRHGRLSWACCCTPPTTPPRHVNLPPTGNRGPGVLHITHFG